METDSKSIDEIKGHLLQGGHADRTMESATCLITIDWTLEEVDVAEN